MKPLHVVAHLRGAIADKSKALMLDALLMHAAATRDGLPPPPPIRDIEIPIARSACGRVFLASQGISKDGEHEHRWKNRRAPILEMQLLGDAKLRRINLQGGPNRSYRIPLDTVHLEDDEIHWYAVGDESAVEALLVGWVGYLGHRRGVGLGKVAHWHVETMAEPWEGFPVMRDGFPLRPLPLDWPGLDGGAEQALRCLAPPYWRRTSEELCAVPALT